MKERTCVDTKTIAIQLLNEGGADVLPVERHDMLVRFLYKELGRLGRLDDFHIFYDISAFSMQKTAEKSSDVFEYDPYNGCLVIREGLSVSALAEKYSVDDVILSIIRKFCCTDPCGKSCVTRNETLCAI